MGPKFRAAEQSLQTEFQIFPVSLEELDDGCEYLLSLDCVCLCQLLLRDPGAAAIANVYQALNSVTETSDVAGSFSLNRVRSHLTSSGTLLLAPCLLSGQ